MYAGFPKVTPKSLSMALFWGICSAVVKTVASDDSVTVTFSIGTLKIHT